MSHAPSILALVIAVPLAACSAAPIVPPDAPLASDVPLAPDAGPESCDVDRACPEAAPVWGGGCEGTLSCEFPSSCGPTSPDTYECVTGTWTLTMAAPCAGGSPPLAESCATPSTVAIAGARLWLSADAAGAPELVNGDLVMVAFGAQGLAMIPYRVHVDATDAPRCASVSATISLDAMTSSPVVHAVRLRCGDSLRIQDVLPELPCEMREYAVGLDVTVEGVGSVSLDLRAMGGGCMFGG